MSPAPNIADERLMAGVHVGPRLLTRCVEVPSPGVPAGPLRDPVRRHARKQVRVLPNNQTTLQRGIALSGMPAPLPERRP